MSPYCVVPSAHALSKRELATKRVSSVGEVRLRACKKKAADAAYWGLAGMAPTRVGTQAAAAWKVNAQHTAKVQ